MRQLSSLLLVLLFAISFRGMALACRCVDPSLKAAYTKADAVVQVRIDEVSDPLQDGTVTAQAEVLSSWKTKVPHKIQLWTGEDCAYPLRKQETYILYLSRAADRWGTYKCRGNQL